MRINRKKRAVTSQTYQFNLDPSEEAQGLTETLKNVKIGSELMFKCTMSEKMSNLQLRYHQEEIGEFSGDFTKTYTIPKYQRNQAGIYECTGKRPDGKYHFRAVRVVSERDNKTQLPTCTSPSDAEMCGLNGRCVMDNKFKLCECDDGYMGEFCEKIWMTSFDVKMLQVVGGTFTMLNIVCILVAVILLLLYLREKQSKRRVRQKFDDFCKAIEDCDKEYEEGLRIDMEQQKKSSGSFARQSMKKMRLAYQRARLDETDQNPKLIGN